MTPDQDIDMGCLIVPKRCVLMVRFPSSVVESVAAQCYGSR